jgi:DNA relaxase NicK
LAVVFRQVPTEGDALTIIDLLQQTFDDHIEFHPDLPDTNGKRWDGHSTTSLRGTKVWWDAPTDDKAGQLYCYFGGAVLGAATHRAAQDLFACLSAMYGGDCKRFDVALDDFDKEIPLDQVELDVRAGNVSGSRSFQFTESGKIGEAATGKTIYLGSAQSDKRIRIYDKSTQTGGEVDAIRVEVQFRDSKAQTAFLGWIDFDAGAVDVGAPQYLAALVTGAVKFCDRSKGDKNIDRCPMLPWWENLVNRVGQGIKVAAPRVVKTLEKCMGWIDYQVSRSLALIKRAMGDGFTHYIDAVTTLGDERLTAREFAILAIEGYA